MAWDDEMRGMEAERDAARGEVATLAATCDAQDQTITNLSRDLEAYRGARAECERQYQQMLQEALDQVHRAERAEEMQAILMAELKDALEGLREMAPYVPEYYRDKWGHQGYIDRAAAALSGLGAPDPDAECECGHTSEQHEGGAGCCLDGPDGGPDCTCKQFARRVYSLADQGGGSCPECHGSGRVLVNHGIESAPDLGPCPSCRGSGRAVDVASTTVRDALVEAAVGLRLFEGREKQNLPAYVAYFEPGDWYRFVDAVAAYLEAEGRERNDG